MGVWIAGMQIPPAIGVIPAVDTDSMAIVAPLRELAPPRCTGTTVDVVAPAGPEHLGERSALREARLYRLSRAELGLDLTAHTLRVRRTPELVRGDHASGVRLPPRCVLGNDAFVMPSRVYPLLSPPPQLLIGGVDVLDKGMPQPAVGPLLLSRQLRAAADFRRVCSPIQRAPPLTIGHPMLIVVAPALSILHGRLRSGGRGR
ncbi:MAG: hypothetical protein JWM19_1673 [Actinomycetia bacterium]|nr:hypothetical protein [Actinomycetes bacterium]